MPKMSDEFRKNYTSSCTAACAKHMARPVGVVMGSEFSHIRGSFRDLLNSFDADEGECGSTAAVFSDGRLFYSNCGLYNVTNRYIICYNPLNGARRFKVLVPSGISSAVFSTSTALGSILLVGCYDGSVQVHDCMQNGKLVRTLRCAEVLARALLADSDLDSHFNSDEEARRERESNPGSTGKASGAAVVTCVTAPMKHMVFTGDVRGVVSCFNVQDGYQVWISKLVKETTPTAADIVLARRLSAEVTLEAENAVLSICYVPGHATESPKIIASFADAACAVFSAVDGAYLRRLEGVTQAVSKAFYIERWQVYIGCALDHRNTLWVWDLTMLDKPPRELHVSPADGPAPPNMTCTFIDDDHALLVAGFSDGVCELHQINWDAAARSLSTSMWRRFKEAATTGVTPTTSWITAITYDPVADCIVTGNSRGAVRLLPAVTSSLVDK